MHQERSLGHLKPNVLKSVYSVVTKCVQMLCINLMFVLAYASFAWEYNNTGGISETLPSSSKLFSQLCLVLLLDPAGALNQSSRALPS